MAVRWVVCQGGVGEGGWSVRKRWAVDSRCADCPFEERLVSFSPRTPQTVKFCERGCALLKPKKKTARGIFRSVYLLSSTSCSSSSSAANVNIVHACSSLQTSISIHPSTADTRVHGILISHLISVSRAACVGQIWLCLMKSIDPVFILFHLFV